MQLILSPQEGLQFPDPRYQAQSHEHCQKGEPSGNEYGIVMNEVGTYGSPMTKESPAFTDGTRPNEPTSAAAASLVFVRL